ncbi:hypothetical protein PLEOSDRAFT_1107979 [Pleurotus ostreatus PC15]|uniref:Uncharacterized protein n=1 Tax=Pleurotus ostreatus (strain PC15) TaxID=1137138 RepID=A0A067NLT6_PLEO1|nr:hypothetical protein PLEOSDRAFT_1107979 [Pleurotus ostreatus PC15]
MGASAGFLIVFDTFQFCDSRLPSPFPVLKTTFSFTINMARASTRLSASKVSRSNAVASPTTSPTRPSPRKLAGPGGPEVDVNKSASSGKMSSSPPARRGRVGGRSKKLWAAFFAIIVLAAHLPPPLYSPAKEAEAEEEQNPFVDDGVAPVESIEVPGSQEVDEPADDEAELTPKGAGSPAKRKRDVSSPTPRAVPASRGIKQPHFVSPTPPEKRTNIGKRTILPMDRPSTPRPPTLTQAGSFSDVGKHSPVSPGSDIEVLSMPPTPVRKGKAPLASSATATPSTPRISKTMKRQIVVLDESDSEDEAAPSTLSPFDLRLPEILSGLEEGLIASGIVSRLRNAELTTKYPSDRPMTFPMALDVLTWVYNEAQVVALYDAFNFAGCGVYVNPLRADPANFFVDGSTKITHKLGQAKGMAAVFVLPLLVGASSLTKLTSIRANASDGDMHYRLRGAPPPDVWPVALGFLGACYKRDVFHAYLTQGQIQLSTKPLSFEESSPKKRGGATLSRNVAESKPDPNTGSEFVSYPSARSAAMPVPIYDGRFDGNHPAARPGFFFSDREWKNLPALPRYGNKADPKELRTCRQDEQYQIVLAAFTTTTFVPKNSDSKELHLSFNIQFAILLADYIRHAEDTRAPMTLARIISYREQLFSGDEGDDSDDGDDGDDNDDNELASTDEAVSRTPKASRK